MKLDQLPMIERTDEMENDGSARIPINLRSTKTGRSEAAGKARKRCKISGPKGSDRSHAGSAGSIRLNHEWTRTHTTEHSSILAVEHGKVRALFGQGLR